MADMGYGAPKNMNAPVKNRRYPVSIWRRLDIFAALAVVIFGWRFSRFPYFTDTFLTAFFLVPILLLIRRLYRRDKPRKAVFRAITGIIRTALYLCGIGMLLIHCLLFIESPRLYSIHKALYGKNSEMESFLPEELPSDIRDYRCTFMRAPLPGASRIELTFTTSADEVEKFRQRAISAGASQKAEGFNASRDFALK